MKRELKIKYADLRQVGERVNVVKYALEEIEEAAERFERLLGEQESEAVTALLELRRSRLKKDVQACHDHLEALYELLSGYITEMTAVVKPIDEEQEMVVDRNDIWWNMKQIHGNIEESNAIVNELALLGYREETVVRQPQIREEMEAEEVSALWEAYHREFEARERRRENYRKLQGFCQGEARRAKGRLEALYEEIERIYRNHIVVYENTDDGYKKKAEPVYDACSSLVECGLRVWEIGSQNRVALLEGVRDAAWDAVKGIVSLVVFPKMVKIANAAIITDELGITPKWMTRIREGMEETYKGVGRALQNPGRVLAAIGQGATDTLEEKGITYAGSYVVTDVLIGIALDKGLSKLSKAGKVKLVNKLDEVSDAGKVVNEIGEAVIQYGDDVGEAAVKRGLDSGLTKLQIEDIINTPKGSRPDPSSYLSREYIDAHLAQFDDGVSVIQTEWAYSRYSETNGFVGVPDDNSLFVMPKNYCDDVIARANGNISVIEKELGFPEGYFSDGGGLIRIDAPNTTELNIRIPSGNETGANKLWIPGGKTSGGVPEAITNTIPLKDTTITRIDVD